MLCEAGEQVLRHELRKRLLLRFPQGIQPHDREIVPPRVRRIVGAPVPGAQIADSVGRAVELNSRCAQYLLFLEDVSRSLTYQRNTVLLPKNSVSAHLLKCLHARWWTETAYSARL